MIIDKIITQLAIHVKLQYLSKQHENDILEHPRWCMCPSPQTLNVPPYEYLYRIHMHGQKRYV